MPFKIGVIPFIYVFQKVNCFLLKWYFVQHFPSGFRLTWEHSQCWINCQLMVDGFSFYVFICYRNIWHIFQVEFIYYASLLSKLETLRIFFEHIDMLVRYTDLRYFATYEVVHGCGKTFVSKIEISLCILQSRFLDNIKHSQFYPHCRKSF